MGETLTADPSGIADADGLTNASFSYQWLADGAEIAGATSSTCVPTADDEDKAIRVRVNFTDDRNHQESLTSAATAAVAAAVDTSAVWSATLAAGSIWGFSGFWEEAGIGELTPQVFTLDGVEYTVQAVIDYVGLDLLLILDKALPVGFTLQVDNATFSSEDASVSNQCTYSWELSEVLLADGDTVEVSVTLAD